MRIDFRNLRLIRLFSSVFFARYQRTTRHSTPRVAARAGTATAAPYFTKVPKPIGTCSFLSMPSHIMPANAPTGVRYAPMLEAATAANTAYFAALPTIAPLSTIALYSTDIGMLLTTLAATNALPPTVHTGCPSARSPAMRIVSPL